MQSTGSPFAGAWLPLHLIACALLLRQGSYPKLNIFGYAALAWLSWLVLSTFFMRPIAGSGIFFWMLASMPALALCLKRANLPQYVRCFGAVIGLYVIGLIGQLLFSVHYTVLDFEGRRAWPLIDPNNAAAIINIGLIPSFYFLLRGTLGRLWVEAFVIMALGVFITGSVTGIAVAIGVCGLIAIFYYGALSLLLAVPAALLVLIGTLAYNPGIIVSRSVSLMERVSMVKAAWQLAWLHPWTGLGLSSFPFYYAQIRTEYMTAGWHCHNDLLQIAIELGVPAALLFTAMLLLFICRTSRHNAVTGYIILAITLQALLEFQFYIPSVSLVMGLVLGYHLINYAPARRRVVDRQWLAA